MPATLIRDLLSGQERLRIEEWGDTGAPVEHVPDSVEVRAATAFWRRLRPRGAPEIDPETIYRIALASRGDAEVKAARVLRQAPISIATIAHGLWGRSLTAERDARAAERGKGLDPRRLQALRSVITRELLKELRPILVPKKKQTNRRRSR